MKLTIIGEFAGALANALGDQTALGKAAAIAQATINTYLGATGAFKDTTGPIWVRVAAASVAVLNGIANIRKILAVNTNISKGGSNQQPTAGGIPRFVATRVNETAFTARGNTAFIPSSGSTQTVNNINNTTGLNASDIKTIVQSMPRPVVTVEDINRESSRKSKIEVKSNIL